MAQWVRNSAGVFTLIGAGRTAMMPEQTLPVPSEFVIQLAPPASAHHVFQMLPSSGDGRSGYEIGVVGMDIVIRSIMFADPATVVVVATAAHGLSSGVPFIQAVRFVDGKIEVRLNGAEAAALSYTPLLFDGFKHFGFVSNVNGAQVISAEICTLIPQTVDRTDLLHAACGGDYFEISGVDWVQLKAGVLTGTVRLLKAGAFKAAGDVCLVQFHTFVLGFDGAHGRECDIVTGTVGDLIPTAGTLPGATPDPANPGQFLPGTTTVSIADVYRDRLGMVFGPEDPQNILYSAVGDHRDLDTGSENIGHAYGLGTGIAKVGQPITCLVRSSRNSHVIGCNDSVWELTGDPSTGLAELQEILNKSGISGKDAVATLSDGRLVFHSPGGVFLLPPLGNPTPLSSSVLTEGINIDRDQVGSHAVQVRCDPTRQLVYFFLTPRTAPGPSPTGDDVPATHVTYDERVGGYQPASGGWFPDDFASRFGPTASTPDPFQGRHVLGTRDGYLMVLDDDLETDDGEIVTVRLPLSLFRESKINRETILHKFLIQPGDGCTVKYRVWGALTAQKLYGYTDGRYLLQSGSANEIRREVTRKSRAPVMFIELYNDEATPFEVEETDANTSLGRIVTRHDLAAAPDPGEPCTPPLYPLSSELTEDSIIPTSGPGGGTQFSSAEGSSGLSEIISDVSPISYSTPIGFTDPASLPSNFLTIEHPSSSGGGPTESIVSVGATVNTIPHSGSSGASSFDSIVSGCTIVTMAEGDAHTICPTTGIHTIGNGSISGGTSISGDSGWTDASPSADSRLIYVSNSTGSDSNSGSLVAPLRTIAAAYALMRDGFPDWMYLRSSDTFTEAFPDWAKSGRSDTERMVITRYGIGERPLLKTGTASGFQVRGLNGGRDRAHILLTGIHLWAHTNIGAADCTGIGITAGGGVPSDIIVEDCYIHQYSNNFGCEGIETRATLIKVRRSIIADALSQSGHALGLIVGQTDGFLIEECYFDHNGWSEVFAGCPALQNEHSLYINPDNTTGGVVRGNIVARSSACAIRSSTALCELNVCLQNPIGITVGPDTSIVRYNTILDSRDIGSDPRGLGIDGTIGPNVQIYQNVLAHQTSGTGNTKGINLQGDGTGLRLHHNTVYKWIQGINTDAPALYLGWATTSDCRIYSNDFQQGAGCTIQRATIISGTLEIFTGNRYYSTIGTPFTEPDGSKTYAQWVTRTGETASANGAVSYSDGNRTIATYMASLGLTATLDAFMAACRLQSRATWDPRFTAKAVRDYVWAGLV